MTIWKFPLRVADVQDVKMPDGARVLTIQMQRGEPCLWALVDASAPLVPVRIAIVGTGRHIATTDGYEYIGTFQLNDGTFVFHVFRTPR